MTKLGKAQKVLAPLAASVILSSCVAHAPLGSRSEALPAGTDVVAATVESMRAETRSIDAAEGATREQRKKSPPPAKHVELEPVSATEFELTSDKQDVVGVVQLIRARDDDTFSDIARTYGLGYDDLIQANPGIDPWLPGAGTPIVLPTQFVLPSAPREGVVLNIAAKRLFYFPESPAGEPRRVITHPIGIGREGWATPTGRSKVIAKAKNPTWYVPLSVRQEHREMGDPIPAVVPPGEDNPLGHRVLKLDLEGYLIHGTNQPYGVGMRVSHGCVRLYPENIETLYDSVALSTPVTIVNEPLVGGWLDGNFYLEAHPPLADDDRDPDEMLADILASAAAETKYPGGDELFRNAVETATGGRGYPVALFSENGDTSKAPRPITVRNVVVVDNPVSEKELQELLTADDQPPT